VHFPIVAVPRVPQSRASPRSSAEGVRASIAESRVHRIAGAHRRALPTGAAGPCAGL